MKKKQSPRTSAKRIQYHAKSGARINDHDAAIIGRFCDRLIRKYQTITAETFVEEASRDNTVRDYLVWDNDEAAHKWRLHQARVLLGSVTVVVERHDKQVEVRGLHFMDSQKGYVPAARIFSDESMVAELAAKAKRDAIVWYHRYQNIRSCLEITPLFNEIERLIEEELAIGTRSAAE